MLYQTIYYGAWITSALACLATAARLWRSNRRVEFKTFFLYLVLVGLHGLVNLALSLVSPVAWFFSFYIGNLITSLLGFAVLYEASKAAVSTRLFKLRSSSFSRICAAAAVLAVLVCAVVDVQGTNFIRARVLLELALRVMQLSILLVFAVVSAIFGLFWRRTEFGIVLGYGCYAAVQLALMAHRASGAASSPQFIALIPLISFVGSTIVWLLYAGMRATTPASNVGNLVPELDESLEFAQRMQA